MKWRVAVAVACVVLAGCSGTPTLPGADSPGADGPGAATPQPWADTTFVVAVADGPDRERYVAATRNATGFWERNAEQYLGHPVRFSVEPDADDPDVSVRAVEAITDCGTDDHAAGCAPRPDDLRRLTEVADVRVQRGFDDASTARVLRHEFGHVLSLTHRDAPQSVMSGEAVLATVPKADVTERPVPWNDSRMTVFVDDRNVSADDRAAVAAQIDHAMAYYTDGAEGSVPANVSFERVADRTAADVTVSFPDPLPCGDTTADPGSCAELRGTDPDHDGALEMLTSVDIYVGDLDTDTVGWHVARQFGTAMGASGPADLPPVLRDASYRERRSDWWN